MGLTAGITGDSCFQQSKYHFISFLRTLLMGRFMLYFLSSRDDFKWGLDAMKMQLSLKGPNWLGEQKIVFLKRNPEIWEAFM